LPRPPVAIAKASRNKRRPNLFWRWRLRRLPGAIRWPSLSLRAYPGDCRGWPADRQRARAARAISGQRNLVRSRAIRYLLRRLERPSLLVLTARSMTRTVRFGRPPSLTAHQRQAALQRLAEGPTQADLARSCGVSQATIRLIYRKERPQGGCRRGLATVSIDPWREISAAAMLTMSKRASRIMADKKKARRSPRWIRRPARRFEVAASLRTPRRRPVGVPDRAVPKAAFFKLFPKKYFRFRVTRRAAGSSLGWRSRSALAIWIGSPHLAGNKGEQPC
jgi:hypothetical protein